MSPRSCSPAAKARAWARPRRFGDEPLISDIVHSLKADFDHIVVVAAPQQQLLPLPARLTRDEVPFQGPIDVFAVDYRLPPVKIVSLLAMRRFLI